MSKADKRRIAELESEVGELQDFHRRNREQLAQYEAALGTIVNEHQPRIVRRRKGIGFELRCRRCQTDEHHTWADENYVPWPCPTIAPIVAYATYELTPESGEVQS